MSAALHEGDLERDPAKLPWKELGVEIALECTGLFTDKEKAGKHLEAGAKRVLISAPATNADLTVVYGVTTTSCRSRTPSFPLLLHHQLPGAGRPRASTTHSASSAAT